MSSRTRDDTGTDTAPFDDAALRERAAKLTVESDDIDAVRKALDSAAGTSRGLWITFLTFGTYLVVAVGSVTHTDLMLQNPIRLPLLNVDLPLVSFFWVAPILLLVFHAYLLLHLKILADLVYRYMDLARESGVAEPVLRRLSMQLPTFVLAKVFAAQKLRSNELLDIVLAIASGITIVAAPIILFIFMQMQFLPYHHPWVTWLHRAAIGADLALILYFAWKVCWIDPRHGGSKRALTLSSVATILIVYFSVFVATFPTEPMQNPQSRAVQAASLRTLLFESEIDEVALRRKSRFSNTIVALGGDLGKAASGDGTRLFRGRDLYGAILAGADLRNVDLTGADLREVVLRNADLRGADFGCRNGVCANLRDADLRGADLRGANLDGASLDGANLENADLRAANLRQASLRGTWLAGAKLAAANMYEADAAGAVFEHAFVQGAQLERARLQGTLLTGTDFTAATLQDADLRGANIAHTSFQGASLTGAILDASLVSDPNTRELLADGSIRARMLTANNNFPVEDFRRVFSREEEWREKSDAWLADVEENENTRRARIQFDKLKPQFSVGALFGGKKAAGSDAAGRDDTLTERKLESVDRWKAIMAAALAPSSRSAAQPCAPGTDAPDLRRRVVVWMALACSPNSDPQVVEGMTRRASTTNVSLLELAGIYRKAAATHLLDPVKCPGARGMSGPVRDRLTIWSQMREQCSMDLPASVYDWSRMPSGGIGWR